jgi:hypothetical protein
MHDARMVLRVALAFLSMLLGNWFIWHGDPRYGFLLVLVGMGLSPGAMVGVVFAAALVVAIPVNVLIRAL